MLSTSLIPSVPLATCSFFRPDGDGIVGRRSLTEPDLPSQSGMALDVPSLDVCVTRYYPSLFIMSLPETYFLPVASVVRLSVTKHCPLRNSKTV